MKSASAPVRGPWSGQHVNDRVNVGTMPETLCRSMGYGSRPPVGGSLGTDSIGSRGRSLARHPLDPGRIGAGGALARFHMINLA